MNPDRPYHSEEQDPQDLRNWHWPPHWTSEPPGLHHEDLTPASSAYHTPLSEFAFADRSGFSNPRPYSYVETLDPHLQGHWRPIPRSMSVSALPTSVPSSAHSRHEHSLPPPPKQIRFVSNDGQPYTKRRRIDVACQTCRKRKTKCSGERPECKTCLETGHPCLGYTEHTQQQSHHRKSSADNQSTLEDDDGDSHSRSPTKSDNRRQPPNEARKPIKDVETAKPRMQQKSSVESSTSVPEAVVSRRDRDVDQPSDGRSPASNYTSVSINSARNRVPYFRYFGPTAIVPGFKQMVVQMKEQRRSTASLTAESPASNLAAATCHTTLGLTPATTDTESRPPVDIPFYEAADSSPNPPIITHLCETFFTHLGCNYPFLQRERFLHDLEEKRVDAILVDAVCAVAARFSAHPLLSVPTSFAVPLDSDNEVLKAFRGYPFAHRAMAAVVDTFPRPTIAVAQACLLLAYEEFGSDHDSGLWMYLGTSIRMAQDLGMQKLEGMQLEGRIGPTPKTTKKGPDGKEEEGKREQQQWKLSEVSKLLEGASLQDRRASEQERIDTFYCIFFLDRVVSSGTGRPVTLRDKDIEISFPYKPDYHSIDGWPQPFPPLIRIVHLYGRVTDVLNNISESNQVTTDTMKRLAGMERDLTGIYQRLSSKLHFNATNFQQYVKAGQGTNFILLHFWFHTLIVLLHQPTLLHSFEGSIHQLFPDSRELSMSSAKTIADILAFAELIDVNSFIGNPFTSQPMYIAASAFLMEAAAHASQSQSRASTPLSAPPENKQGLETRDSDKKQTTTEEKLTTKYTLLATAANQNYQRCYKSLKSLETYWAGTRYILTVLDQKAKGIMNPLLFTSDDLDSEMPPTEPDFSTPGWRSSTSNGGGSLPTTTATGSFSRFRTGNGSASIWSSNVDPSQAVGWSLAGSTNSPNPNLSFLYQTSNRQPIGSLSQQVDVPSPYDAAAANLPLGSAAATAQAAAKSSALNKPPTNRYSSEDRTGNGHYVGLDCMSPRMTSRRPDVPPGSASAAEADLLLGLHGQDSFNSVRNASTERGNLDQSLPPSQTRAGAPQPAFDCSLVVSDQATSLWKPINPTTLDGSNAALFNDMIIQSQDIDMNASQEIFAFPGGDITPWLEHLPQDILNYFGDPPDEGSMMNSAGPGPAPPPP